MTRQRDPKSGPGRQRPLTYYDVLDLDRDATPEEIKAAYYKLAREHHPDVADEDSQVTQKFALISEAYGILSDPQRRHQYDRTLPQKSYPLRHPTPEKIWREATEVVLIRSDRFGPLNQAMQAAIPITLDGDILVVTLPGSERHLSGHLDTASNRNAILNALELVSGGRLTFRIIDGTTVEDWQILKQAEKRRVASAARRQATPSAPTVRVGGAAVGPWDELLQQLHRRYQELPRRQYAQAKARYLRESLGLILRVEEETRLEGEVDEDAHERALARALERVATIVELPAVVVAYEFERIKRTGDF